MSSDPVTNLRRSSRNRESFDEITDLEVELRRAYMAKELQAQIEERATERYIASIREQHAEKVARLQQQLDLENDLCQRSQELERSNEYRRHLEEQIAQKEQEKKINDEEARIEREILTEVDRIREQSERSKALETKNDLAEQMQREYLIVQEIKEIRREEEQEAEAKKLLKDLEYQEELERRSKEVAKLRQEQLEKKEAVVKEIARMIMDAESRKLERQALMIELVVEDVKQELRIREQEEVIRRSKMKQELAASLEEQILFTERCKLRFVEQDRLFAEQVMKRIMEDERTDRLTAEARRRMQLRYQEDLARLVQERSRARDEEIRRMEEDAREERAREKVRSERVRELRKSLLREHVSNVAGFVKMGALTPEERGIVEESERRCDQDSTSRSGNAD